MNKELEFNSEDINRQIRKQEEAEGVKPKPVKALNAPVLAKSHTPIYKMHRYYARRPWNVFSHIIKNYTNPGDLILDPFCGGGVTVVEGLKSKRKVIGVDVNRLATWISIVEVQPQDLDELDKSFNDWIANITKQINKFYKAKCGKCKKYGIAEWFEWSNAVECPHCKEAIILGKAKKIRAGVFQCTNKDCKAKIKPNECKIKKDVLLNTKVRCENCKSSTVRIATSDDIKIYKNIKKISESFIKKEHLIIPNDEFPDMDRARDDNIFGKGIKYFKDFMTVRQLLSMAYIKKHIPSRLNVETANSIFHIFSASLRYINKFVFRSEGWQGGNPIEWAGHNYWLPFIYYELNPLDALNKKYKTLIAGKNEQKKTIGSYCQFPITKKPWEEMQKGATCWIINQSSDDLQIQDHCIDAIITDPPFGGNVQYGELSDFYLVWLREFLNIKDLSNKENEAIETRNSGFKGAKDREFYENMLYKIFRECRRVIKPDGWMVLTFHNRDLGVWMSLHRAANRAGFRLPAENESLNRGMVYQPPVENYTQTIHQRAAGSMLGDFILSFKPIDAPIQLEGIKSKLSLEEEKKLQDKAAEIIRYHGGADDTTLMTGLIPYLYENSLLHRIAKFDLRVLLENGPFVFISKEKKWYNKDMVEETGSLKPLDALPSEAFVEKIIHSYLSEHKQATMDDLLVVIYENLVNAHRPQISTIGKVLNKYCKKRKIKGQKRELFVWNPRVKTPEELDKILSSQAAFDFEIPAVLEHNEIIKFISNFAISKKYYIHVGKTEQRKSSGLAQISVNLSGLELGLSPDIFKHIQEIDLIVLKGNTIVSAVEVATTISTFNKAINDRFRNILTIAPNLNVNLGIVINDIDYEKASLELNTPANRKDGLSKKIKIWKTRDINSNNFKEWLISF